MPALVARYRYGGTQLPGAQRITTMSPSSVSSPANRRSGTQRPPAKEPSSTVAMPASGGPGVLGENVDSYPAAGHVDLVRARRNENRRPVGERRNGRRLSHGRNAGRQECSFERVIPHLIF